MSKTILIVESDSALSRNMRAELEGKGFEVAETSDGKGAPELIRRQHPELVVLAVDLSAGQNGYIICGKLKKDDELKAVPVVIIGNPDGFAQHKKLKTRADEYVAKPVDLQALVERIGGLIGLPEPVEGEVVDESLSLSDLVEEEEGQTNEMRAPEEISLDTPADDMVQGDPELDMLDAAFDDIATDPTKGKQAPPEEPEIISEPEPEASPEQEPEEAISLSNVIEETDDSDQKTQIGVPLPKAPPPPPVERRVTPGGGVSAADLAELRELRSKVKELQGALEDANSQAGEQESRLRELETEVVAKAADLEAAKSSGGKHDKEFFALRDAATKKDKEILRLKGELNQKENEIVELQDKQNQLEQATSESSGEMARRDAQIKTLSTKADQLTAERRKIDQQLMAAKEEARTASSKLSTLQSDFDQAQDRLAASDGELEGLRAAQADLESQAQAAKDEADELRRQVEEQREQVESAKREADESRTGLETAQMDLDSAKNQLTTQATAFAEEAASLRKRISELEESSVKHEERVTKLYGRIKGDEKVREKTKKALSIALQLLEEQPGANEADDEEAVA
ncbi:MAG: response regulator [Myxococcaceae bacterium]